MGKAYIYSRGVDCKSVQRGVCLFEQPLMFHRVSDNGGIMNEVVAGVATMYGGRIFITRGRNKGGYKRSAFILEP
jgi:hypothetical protein